VDRRARLTFAWLVASMTAHTLEEYAARLYDEFPPTRFVIGLVAGDRRFGFFVLTVALVAIGVVCVAEVWRGRWSGVMWIWIAVAIVNGVTHLVWSVVRGGYTPGVATAPVLLVLAIILARQLSMPVSSRP
jgi:hypothetical protein